MRYAIPVLFTLAAPAFVGCAAPMASGGGGLMQAAPPRGQLAYMPTKPPTGRLPSNLPKIMLARVSDESGGGDFRGPISYAMPVRWSDIVHDALQIELGRVGWATTRSQDMAGAVLKASVTRVSAAWRAGIMVPVQGQVRIALLLRDPSGQDVWEGELVGDGRGVAGGGGIPGNGIKQALTAALHEAVGSLGGVLEQERPWERLGKPRPQAAAPVASVPAPAPAPRAGWSDVDQVPAGRGKRKGHAVIIGIERYREKLPQADFAASDASTMAKYASRVLGFPEENVALLTDDKATRGDFEKYFERWLANRVEKDDEVFVYFSGHGAPNPKTGDAYLVPYDGDPTYLAETGYPLRELYASLAKLPTKKVTVALDSCFSGAGGRSVLAKGSRPLVTVQTEVAPSGLTVLSAAAGDQVSNSYAEKGHGLFTYFLLKGLKERGADLRAAFDYAKPEVSKVARREYNADQEPQWREGR